MARNIDWDAIEKEYRTNQISDLALAKKHGISHTAIQKRAAKGGWQRDLAQDVAKATKRLIVEDIAKTGKVADPEKVAAVATSNASDEEIVEAAARVGAQVVRSHRSDIMRGMTMVRILFGELEESTRHRELIEDEILDETDSDSPGVKAKRRAIMHRAVALPSRAQTMKCLADAMSRLIGNERVAFNLDQKIDPSQLTTEQIHEILAQEHNGR